MKILQFCSKPPLPAIDGGCLASYELSQDLLASGAELNVLTLATEKHPFLPNSIDESYLKDTSLEALNISTRASMPALFFNLLNGNSIYRERFYQNHIRALIKSHLEKKTYDIVLFDGLMTSFYFDDVRKYSKAKLIYRSHNVESDLLKSRALAEGNAFKKTYLGIQSKRLEQVEKNFWQSADAIWSISPKDLKHIKGSIQDASKATLLPFCCLAKKSRGDVKANSLFHLGSMDWKPNSDGVQWFTREVWPKVLEKQKNVELHLGGKEIDRFQKELKGPNVFIHDRVPNADEFYNAFEIMIVPIHVGSGIRIKLIQALSKGKIIASTKEGAEGIPAQQGIDMMISNNAQEMAEQLIELLLDANKKEKLARGAQTLFKEHFSREKNVERLNALIYS